ncbi:MAG: outer membrane beta-barrel protein [Bacteroidetes bacterium]|nr:outer membrane beta-barrel protein [Bacteroidota bacterium]
MFKKLRFVNLPKRGRMLSVIKKVLPVVCLIALMPDSQAQGWKRESSLEFGLMFGGSNYKGDLVPKFFESRGTHANGGILIRYNPVQRFSFRLGVNYGSISGDDNWYGEDEVRAARNLHFKSDIWDIHAGFDINLNTFRYKQERGIIPHLILGIAVFKFNPMAQFTYDPSSWQATALQSYDNLQSRDGDWVELQPIGTEGQETTEYNDLKRYSLTSFAIPVGAGFKFKLSRQWTFGIEYTTRITFTDYLDDVSGKYVEPVFLESQYGPISAAMSDRSKTQNLAGTQRGDDSKRDLYSIFGVTLTYRIMRSGDRCPAFL